MDATPVISKATDMNLYVFTEPSRAAVYGVGTYIRELIAALRHSQINVCVVHLRSDKESQDICTHIAYTGMLDQSQLNEWYCIADVGVVPSLFLTFGYVAVEMMMHGLPVVAAATSGLNEVVGDTCGLKIPLIKHTDKVEIDPGVLAAKVVNLLQNQGERKRLGKNARKRYLEKYSLPVFKKQMFDFYRSLYSV